LLFRVYVTDALHGISNGKGIGVRFWDLLHPNTEQEETRSAEEIIAHVRSVLDGGGDAPK